MRTMFRLTLRDNLGPDWGACYTITRMSNVEILQADSRLKMGTEETTYKKMEDEDTPL
jgi:hypothetical protein